MEDSLYIVMPAYNEEENIQHVIEEWYPMLAGTSGNSRLVVADSGSSDNTHKILKTLSKKYSKLIILETKFKEHGPKLIALYKNAIDNKADYVFQTDSDGQTSPLEFENFWKYRKEFDAIFGCREKREDGHGRAFVERVVSRLIKMYFNVDTRDANAPFRLMKAQALKRYIPMLPDDFNIPNIMITTFFEFYKNHISYINISFKPRIKGKSSLNIFKISKIGIKALKDFKSFKKEMIS